MRKHPSVQPRSVLPRRHSNEWLPLIRQDVFPTGKLRETLCVSFTSPPRGKAWMRRRERAPALRCVHSSHHSVGATIGRPLSYRSIYGSPVQGELAWNTPEGLFHAFSILFYSVTIPPSCSA